MRIFLTLALLFPLSLSAQTLYLGDNSTALAPHLVPEGTYASVSARVTGVNNKGVTWTATGGTLFNQNCTITNNGLCDVQITSATTTGVLTLTATPLDGTVSAKTTHIQFTTPQTPTNTGTTPNYIITASNIAALQARATSSNVTFTALKARAIILYNNDVAAGWTFTCNGGSGLPTVNPGYPPFIPIRYYAYMNAMGDTTHNWACVAHDELLYTMANLQTGALPFSGNTWSDLSYNAVEGIAWSVQFGAITTTPDLNATRQFLAWAGRTINNYGNGTQPFPTNYNSSYQWNGDANQFDLVDARDYGSNYTMSKLVWNVGIGLMFKDDTTDDPLLTGSANTCSAARGAICSDYSAGSLHSYWQLATQYMLKMYGHLEQKELAYNALNAAFPSGGFGSSIQCLTQFAGATQECLGDGIDGEGSEGDWYGYSFFRAITAFNMINGAGYNDPRPVTAGGYGPQLSLPNIEWWDDFDWSSRELLTGSYTASQPQGPAYGYFPTGDANAIQRFPLDYQTMAEELISDTYTGRTDRTNDLLWYTMNFAPGGTDGTHGSCVSGCGFDNSMATDFGIDNGMGIFVTQSVNDPQTLAPTDPGAGYPTDWWNNGYTQHQAVRTGFANTDTAVEVYGSGNTLIDHDAPTDGRFDVWYNGGLITRGSIVFTDYVYPLYSTGRQNMVQIYDQPGVAAGNLDTCFADNTGYYGGQLFHGYQRGITLGTVHSEMPNYTFFGTNQALSQNGCWTGTVWQFTDTTQAYRDVLYLRGSKQVIWYDRDSTTHTASTKTLFLNTTGNGTVTGSRVTWNTTSGSNAAAFTSLLPAGATVAAAKLTGYVTLTAPHSSLQNTTTMQGVCTVTRMDTTTANISSTATWLSDAPGVATVSSSGLITAVSVGTANISCAAPPVDNLPAVYDTNEPPPFVSTGAVTVISGASSGSLTGSTRTTQTGDWELIGNLSVTPSGTPLAANFLSGLEWGASGFTPATMTLVQSSAGQGFDCDLANTTMVCFMRVLGSFTGTTVAAAATNYFSNLAPNTSYGITGTGAPTSATSDDAGVLTFAATGTGSITVSPNSGPTLPPVVLSGGVQIKGGATIQ